MAVSKSFLGLKKKGIIHLTLQNRKFLMESFPSLQKWDTDIALLIKSSLRPRNPSFISYHRMWQNQASQKQFPTGSELILKSATYWPLSIGYLPSSTVSFKIKIFFATVWMDLESIMFNEISQIENRNILYHLYEESKKNETIIYNKTKQTLKQKEQIKMVTIRRE